MKIKWWIGAILEGIHVLLRYLPLLPTQYLSRTLAGNVVLKDTETTRHVPLVVNQTHLEQTHFKIESLFHTLLPKTAQLRSDSDATVWLHWNDAK